MYITALELWNTNDRVPEMIRSPISILQTRLKSVSKQSCTLLVSFPVQIFAEVCYRSRRNSHVFAFCRSTTDAGHNWLVFMSWYKFVPFSFMFALTALAWQPVHLDAPLPASLCCWALPHKARALPWRYWFGDEDSMCANASLFGCSAPGVLLLASAVSRSKSLYSVSIKRSAGSGRS